jgi:hypothetical protein
MSGEKNTLEPCLGKKHLRTMSENKHIRTMSGKKTH